jgi:phytoene synthase
VTPSPSPTFDPASGGSHGAATLSPREITRRSGSSFTVSFGFLSLERREALTAIYAFCRVVDDAVDDAPDPAAGRTALAFWNDELARAALGEARSAVGIAIGDAMRRFGVEQRHLQSVADGVAMDLDEVAYSTFDELRLYCFRVASSVGLACLPVFGATGEAAERYATDLGLALQHTNILRDQRSDAEQRRIYVPRELLDPHGVESAWLEGRGPAEVYRPGGPMATVAQAMAARARSHFDLAVAALGEVEPGARRGLLPAEVMGAVYREVLVRLERLGGEICRRRRVRVPSWRKLWLALGVRRQMGSAR